jgi:hypothetical protein
MTTRIRLVLLASGPILFALISIAIGKKTGWDFYNYHWYNPFALLNDRFGFDVAVAHHATYYNPLSDVPLYLIANHTPAWVGGVFTGAMAGLAVSLVAATTYHTFIIANERARLLVAMSLGLLGAFGAGAFQEIGDPANDIPAAIGVFAALLMLVKNIGSLEHESLSSSTIRLLSIAGLFTGAAVGLKLTTAIYALGIGAAVLMLSGSFKTRLLRTCVFGVGATFGMLLLGGFWMWRMWQFSGNPFFPYFNDFFHSPLLIATGYLDPSFRPSDWVERLLFPYFFTVDSRNASESVFRDGHILAIYILIPVTTAIIYFRKDKSPSSNALVSSSPIKLLFTFAAISYLAWLFIFNIYRYLIPLEMFSPLLIAAAFAAWPISLKWRLIAIIATLGLLQLLVRIDISDRQPWGQRYVTVDVPSFDQSKNPMILMAGHEPMAYVIPSFPKQIPFVRIDGWLVHGDDTTTGLALAMRQRVSAHTGELYMLFTKREAAAALKASHHYGLVLDTQHPLCTLVTSSIGNPLTLCPLQLKKD